MENLLEENLERMDCAAFLAHRRGFRRRDAVALNLLLSGLFSDADAATEDIDRPIDPFLLGSGDDATAIFE